MDAFSAYSPQLHSPGVSASAVTPDDNVDLPFSSRALYVGTAGDVSVVMLDGTSAVFKNVGNGAMLPIRVRRVKSTNTTATNIVAVS